MEQPVEFALGRALKILHVHSGHLYGGVETLLCTLGSISASPKNAGLIHQFALCFDMRLAAELRSRHSKVFQLGEVQVRRPLSILKARRRLKRLIMTENFDAVICHMPWSQALFGPVVRRRAKPLLFWSHTLIDGRHWLERWARLTKPEVCICNSSYAAINLKRLYPKQPIEVVYPPVPVLAAPVEARSELRTTQGAIANTIVILIAARFEIGKGHLTLIEALASLKGEPNWLCWVAGSAQTAEQEECLQLLKNKVERLDLGARFKWLGHRSDVPSLMAAADIYCQPNTAPETFGIALVEALYSKLPVVACQIGSTPEIINGSCGILVEPGNPISLGAALKLLMNQHEERLTLSSAGPARAAELCDLRRQTVRLATIIQSQVRNRRLLN